MALGESVAITIERLTEPVEGVHLALNARFFEAVGRGDAHVRRVHDSIVGGMYRSVRLAAGLVGAGLDLGVSLEQGTVDRVQASTNALWGDSLANRGSELAIEMGLRDCHGHPIQVPDGLIESFPLATGHLVLLVHGLGETEQCWIGDEAAPGMARVMESRQGLSTALIRYNTGLHVAENGVLLDRLIDDVVSGWPVPIRTVALVGHSMGGLVVRSACLAAASSGTGWIDNVGDIITLGTPHRGAPLEKIVNIIAWGMSSTPETRPIADYLNGRSSGIKDLRYGAVVNDDWQGLDIDSLLSGSIGNHALPPGIDHHFVAGVVTDDPNHPLGIVLGDLMVREPSGTAAGSLEPLNTVVVGDTRHFDFLADALVTDRVIEWIAPDGETVTTEGLQPGGRNLSVAGT